MSVSRLFHHDAKPPSRPCLVEDVLLTLPEIWSFAMILAKGSASFLPGYLGSFRDNKGWHYLELIA